MTAPSWFYGLWTLDREASDYGDVPVPVWAEYTMLPSGPGVAFHVRWADPEGGTHEVAYDAILDGIPRPLPDGHDIVGRMRGTSVVTEVLRDGEVAHTSVRTVQGERLLVVQSVGPRRTVGVYRRGRVKQVLVYRRDLGMRKGKIAAQCAHASMKVLLDRDRGDANALLVPIRGALAVWIRQGSAKIVLSVADEADLLRVHEAARAADLPTALITDAGRTEFAGVPTRTAVAVGPAEAGRIDAITGPEGLVATKLA